MILQVAFAMSHPQDSQDVVLVDMTLDYYFWAVLVCPGEARNPLFASEKLPPWQAPHSHLFTLKNGWLELDHYHHTPPKKGHLWNSVIPKWKYLDILERDGPRVRRPLLSRHHRSRWHRIRCTMSLPGSQWRKRATIEWKDIMINMWNLEQSF